MIRRPTRAELAEATGRTIPDLIAPDLRLLLVGINPGLYSGATGYHFARPGNRFWKSLHLAGFCERILAPDEGGELLARGIGITNLVERTTAAAAELAVDELVRGAGALEATAQRYRPDTIACLGVSAYRVAFGRPRAVVGEQPVRLGPARVWVLPNPSGLNAHYQLPALVSLFSELREALELPIAG